MAGVTLLWRTYKEVVKKETPAQELFSLHKKYGSIVRIPPNDVAADVAALHFGNPSAFHKIYNVSKRWGKDDGLYSVPGFKTGPSMFRKYAQAKERRDVLMPMFSRRAIRNIGSLVWQNATQVASSISKLNAAQHSIDLLYAFRPFTLDTIMGSMFDGCVDALHASAFADPLILAIDATLPVLPLLKNILWICTLAMPNSDELAPRIYQVRDITNKQLGEVLHALEKLDDAAHQTIFHRMLDANVYRKTQTVPDLTQLHDEGFAVIFAGANTVADTILMGFYNAMPADLESLPLLTATIKEALRFIPSDVSLTRVVPPGGALLVGREIPGGTIVGMAILHVHQSEEIFADALKFKPERWLNGSNKELEHWLVPFSRGPRACFGYNLAWCELYVAFSTMIQNFDTSLDGTTAEDMEWRECIAAYYPNRHLHAWCRPMGA
ncbi:cytochrome P450 [Didymella exigua CBS 183.55]|uniref:Cytochrome P450 n=1 Tax=Didymella exigua CBS 183.55 TaxID=1150837 RepID=A0A6A5S0W7_9PLEO|nr:cytochrome P450 [Didymella exigua CBS 183.55]KAF1933523.1 cytochrome P450 [Didymella exigua CBS 183.55]